MFSTFCAIFFVVWACRFSICVSYVLMKEMRLSQWAADHGYSYRGALSRFHLGRIPNSYQDEATGSIFVREVDDAPKPTNRAVLYARVSTRSQKSHLGSQMDRMRVFES